MITGDYILDGIRAAVVVTSGSYPSSTLGSGDATGYAPSHAFGHAPAFAPDPALERLPIQRVCRFSCPSPIGLAMLPTYQYRFHRQISCLLHHSAG